jgi:hypothetical protein
MNTKLAWLALVATIATPVAMPTAVSARDHRDYNDRSYNDQGYQAHGHRDRTYRARGGHYRHRCSGGNGAVGTVAGGVGGALIGNALGGGTLGTIAGGVGGGLLGRHLDKQNSRHRNGC